MRFCGWLLLGLTVGLAPLVGCGGSPYPVPQVKTHVGTSQTCHHCSKPIPTVTEANLYTLAGVQYVVCSTECSQRVHEDLDVGGVVVPGADK